nr:LytTR family DNA-binding domain-containing protein [uncultured Holophaga sp.]
MNPEALKVAVAEDEALNRRRLVRMLQQTGCEVLAEFEDGDSLLAWLERGPALDALFLDIRMPGSSGLEVAEALPEPVPVVFVTAFADHAVEAFEAAALDYLLKPVRAERLELCLARLRERRPQPSTPRGRPGRYPVKAGTGIVFLEFSRTTHFEVVEEVVWAHAGGRFQTPWTSLAMVEERFPGAGLLRIHRHLMVRPEAVIGIRPAEAGRVILTFPGGLELLSSRPAAPRIRERLGL